MPVEQGPQWMSTQIARDVDRQTACLGTAKRKMRGKVEKVARQLFAEDGDLVREQGAEAFCAKSHRPIGFAQQPRLFHAAHNTPDFFRKNSQIGRRTLPDDGLRPVSRFPWPPRPVRAEIHCFRQFLAIFTEKTNLLAS